MYRIEKKFTFPMGHRLSKHKGACFNFHGHNYIVLIGMISPKLNENDMVIDFGELKMFANQLFNYWDHALMMNKNDKFKETLVDLKTHVIETECDPTAEAMSKIIFDYLNNNINILRKNAGNNALMVDYVTIYETDGAKATYSME